MSELTKEPESPSTSARSDTAYKVQIRATGGAFLNSRGVVIDSEWQFVELDWRPRAGARPDVEGQLTYALRYWDAIRIVAEVMADESYRIAVRLVPYRRQIETKLTRLEGEEIEYTYLSGFEPKRHV